MSNVLALPGHLILNFEKDLTLIQGLAKGGSGSIFLAQLKRPLVESIDNSTQQERSMVAVKLLRSKLIFKQ